MVTPYKGFKASDGTLHDKERDAYVAELRHYFGGMTMINEASRNALVEHISNDPHALHEIVSKIVIDTPLPGC